MRNDLLRQYLPSLGGSGTKRRTGALGATDFSLPSRGRRPDSRGSLLLLPGQIWDTAGTERFHALGTALYRGSDCCLLVFDVTSVYSFQALEKWHKQLLLQIEPEEEPTFPVAIIGNKTDLENREVSSEEAEMWSRLHDATYFETSAKTAANAGGGVGHIRAVLKNLRVPEEPELNSVHLETKPSEGTHRK
ncbi:hypothetical protein E2320_022373, partial [Naja naja]